MLLSEIFRSENIFWLAFLDQEAASGNLGGGYCAKRSHLRSPSEMYSCGSVQYDKRIKSERESSRRITQPTLQSLRSANQAVSILGPRRRSRYAQQDRQRDLANYQITLAFVLLLVKTKAGLRQRFAN